MVSYAAAFYIEHKLITQSLDYEFNWATGLCDQVFGEVGESATLPTVVTGLGITNGIQGL